MATQDFKITSYDPDAIKSALIAFLQTKPDFVDFNYEGSALNTIIDLLTRNTHYMAYLANMTANESFLSTAQIRSNVVSHAQKLSYTPKSRTASTIVASLVVTPASATSKNNITMDKGSTFINTVDGVAYSFVATEEAILAKNSLGKFTADGISLKQGQLINQKFSYAGSAISIQNKNIDTSTLKMYVRSSLTAERFEFVEVDDITQTESNDRVFFLSENTSGYYEFEFGKNILGMEPVAGSVVEIEYVAVSPSHANGLGTLVAASTIGGYANIVATVTTPAYGGSEKDDIERMRFLAPRIYKAQNRAVIESDFVGVVLRDFPFIKAATSWGGEKNVPPYYGRVFISLIPIEGYNIVDSVKRAIEARLQKYTMMATPVVVDANYSYLDLIIDYVFDDTKTADTSQTIESKIAAKINDYNENYLKQFQFWYNNSELSEELKAIPGVVSIQIRKKAYIIIDVLKGQKTKYEFSFGNILNPGSFQLTGYTLDIAATADTIADDGLGNLIRTYSKAGVTNSISVGTINYITGDVSFIAQFLSTTPDTLKIYVTPSLDDFYTERNKVVAVDNVLVERITNKRVS